MSPEDYAEDAAKDLEGNWRSFGSFAWHDRPADADRWCIVYTKNRDSGLVDESNAHAIDKVMDPFCTGEDDADARSEHHGHWACGWIEGYAIRVRRDDGTLTPAFVAWCELASAIDEYPVLDESDLSEREFEAEIEAWNNWGERDMLNALCKEFELDGAIVEWFESEGRLLALYSDHTSGTEHRDDGPHFPMSWLKPLRRNALAAWIVKRRKEERSREANAA